MVLKAAEQVADLRVGVAIAGDADRAALAEQAVGYLELLTVGSVSVRRIMAPHT